MSEVKNAGIKGYIVMGGLVALFLFLLLVIYVYKANQAMVPEDPERWGSLLESATTTIANLA